MNELLDRLLKILKIEIRLYQSLQSVLQKQQNAVIQAELKSLMTAGDTKEHLLSKLKDLETQRTEIMSALATVLAVPPSDLRLKKVVGLIDEPYASQLRTVRTNLIGVLQGVQATNHNNRALMRHAHQLVRSSLALLNKCILNYSVYYRSGKIQATRRNGTLLSGEV